MDECKEGWDTRKRLYTANKHPRVWAVRSDQSGGIFRSHPGIAGYPSLTGLAPVPIRQYYSLIKYAFIHSLSSQESCW